MPIIGLIVALIPIFEGMFAGHALATILAMLTIQQWGSIAGAIAGLIIHIPQVEVELRKLHTSVDEFVEHIVKFGHEEAARLAHQKYSAKAAPVVPAGVVVPAVIHREAPMVELLPAKAVVSFGMGGQYLDPTYGERWFVERLRAAGVHCADPYQWSDLGKIRDDLLSTPSGWVLAVFGDSLGACEAPEIAALVHGRRIIDCMGGFQPSFWGQHILVPDNVKEAICLYDPSFVFTGGLGAYKWHKAPGNNVTKLSYIPKVARHPDDDDVAVQNVFLAMVHRHRMPAVKAA